MEISDHIRTAREFLEKAELEFAAGDELQASEKLWGAVSHAVIAVSLERGWRCHKHRYLKIAVKRLANETGNANLVNEFSEGEKLHANFYHGFMLGASYHNEIATASSFVDHILALLDT